MGNAQAEGYAGLVDDGQIELNMALIAHLRSNHFPPIPYEMVPVAEEAIEFANKTDIQPELWDHEIGLPEGITFKDHYAVSVRDAVNSLHLDAFLDLPEEW